VRDFGSVASYLITCNPAWDHAERQAREWAVRVGLVADELGRRRLARMAHGRMAGWLAPHTGPGELGLLAQWGAFISLVDDIFDRDQDHGGRPAEVRALMDQLTAVLIVPSAAVDRSVPGVRAIADLWQRTTPSSGLGWTERFAGHYQQFADATCEEARLRASGIRLDLKRYLQLRRQTITVLPMLDLVERHLPIESDALDGLRTIVADTIGLVNDLASAQRDLDDDTENVVSVVARENGCDVHEAAAIVRTMLLERMEDFDVAAAALTASGPWQGGLEPRIARIRDVRDGSVNWQGETHRNKPASGGDRDDTLPLSGGIDPLARHLSLAVAASGAVQDRCASRVLESALLLALLRATHTHLPEQERLAGYLRGRRADADRIDALLIDACLAPAATVKENVDVAALPIAVSRGTVGRGRLKEVMLRTVLHVLCGAPLDARDAPPPMDSGDVTTFTDIHLLSTRVIHAYDGDCPYTVSAGERERLVRLLDKGRPRLLWEASATTHLLGLHAVCQRS
jgi:hypothetical protein